MKIQILNYGQFRSCVIQGQTCLMHLSKVQDRLEKDVENLNTFNTLMLIE